MTEIVPALGVLVGVLRSSAAGILASALVTSQVVIGAEVQKTMSPSFDGWMKNADGTYTLYFGYVNRNPGEVDVPVGPDNQVAPSPTPGGDGGQPTTFQSGRQPHAFRITLPGTFHDKIVWRLGYAGHTETATGSLIPLYLINDNIDLRGNKAPVSNAGPDQTITFGRLVKLQGAISDDGLPKGGTARLTAVWMKYRGPGKVTFDPVDAAVTTATFSTPGTYLLRLRADDSAFVRDDEVTVTVNPRQ